MTSAPNSKSIRRMSHEREYMALSFDLRRTAGVSAGGVLLLPTLLPQQHQEQDSGRRPARNSTLGDAEGDHQDLSRRTLPSTPLEEGNGSAQGTGCHPRQHGRRKKERTRPNGAASGQSAGKAAPSCCPKAGTETNETGEKEIQGEELYRGSAGYSGAGGQRRHPLSHDRRVGHRQDRLLFIPQFGVCLRLRYEFPGPGHQGRSRP